MAEECAVDHGNVVILRLGTVMGLSSVMRFDTLVNQAAFKAYKGETFEIYEPDSWRPFLALSSAVHAFEVAATDSFPGIYNVVSTNIQKRRIGELVKAAGGKVEIVSGGDVRDYAVELPVESSPFHRPLPPMAETWEGHCFDEILVALAEDEKDILCPSLQ